MIIRDAFMMKRMQRALDQANGLYSLQDIGDALREGKMQGHVAQDTWAITQVSDYPKRRVVDISYVVGNLAGSLELEGKITEWAKAHHADLITAVGREGWWEHRTPGWRKTGTLYSKDI